MRHPLRSALILFLVLPLCAQLQSPAPEPVALASESATVNEAKGEVTLRSVKGEPIGVQRGQVLPAGSTIETAKGSILLDLQDGSQVLVKAHSRAVLKAPSQYKGYSLELFLGKVLAKIQKRIGNAPSFKMGTPTAVITVRGTRFLVDVNKKQKTTVEVYEGVVEVLGMGPGVMDRPVLINSGYLTQVERDHEPQRPYRGAAADFTEGRGRDDNFNMRPGAQPGQNQQRTQNSEKTGRDD